MFKPKSPFNPPVVPIVDKKKANFATFNKQAGQDDRTRTNSMLPQKRVRVQLEEDQNDRGPYKKQKLNNLQSVSSKDQRFSFSIQQPDADDNTLYWRYSLGPSVSNQYARKLIFRQQDYFVRGVDPAGVANQIAIFVDDIYGYKNVNGVQTNKACALQLSRQSVSVDDIGMKSYDLIYRQTQDVVWDIPMSVSQLRFRIYVDGVIMDQTLNLPLQCLFDIRHIGK